MEKIHSAGVNPANNNNIKMDKNSEEILKGIVTVMAVVIIVVVSSLIVGTFLDLPVLNNVIVTGTNTNESLGVVTNATNTTLDILITQPSATCSLTVVNNATGGEILTSGNYSFFTNCRLILTDASSYNGSILNATYGFSYTSDLNIVGVNVTQLQEQFGLFVTGLIAFLAIIGIIIGVIWLIFYVRSLFDKKTGLQSITA